MIGTGLQEKDMSLAFSEEVYYNSPTYKEVYDRIKDIINSVEPICDNKIIETVPTRHGYHLISKPFNKKAFYEKYNSSIDIHDNNPTVLYVNLKDDENE